MSPEEEHRERFLLQGIATGPASAQEIASLENQLGHALPAAYRAYLRVCGTHPPTHLVGSNCVLSDVPDNNTAALELFAESGIGLPEQAFVAFLMHQGYFFEFFLVDGSDDPPVYSYKEGDAAVKLSARRFSEWVRCIPGHLKT